MFVILNFLLTLKQKQMKKTNLILALFLASCMGFAQSTSQYPLAGSGQSTGYSGPKPLYVPPTPVISTIAGDGTEGFSGDAGQATAAELGQPQGVGVDISGNVYIADTYNYRIRKVTTAGIISTIAGDGVGGYSGDGGQATAAELGAVGNVTADGSKNIYIADQSNGCIRKINTSGIINFVAGTCATAGAYSGDGGQATAAKFNFPSDVQLDASGNMYIADQNNNAIRKVTKSTGIISTIAGMGPTHGGYSGDGGQATAAKLYAPSSVALDASGNLYIADFGNEVIRMVTASTGIITTIAGTGTSGYTGDGGNATAAELDNPYGVAVYSGNVYIAVTPDNAIRMVASGIINTVAGGSAGFGGDCGEGGSAQLNAPCRVAVDAYGNFLTADQANYRIRKSWPTSNANAGLNQNNDQYCCGWYGAVIGTTAITGVGGLTYSWSPSTDLNSTTIAQPTSQWTNTVYPKVYTLSVTVEGCTATTSTVQVTAVAFNGGNCCRLASTTTDGFSSIALPTNFSVYPNPSNSSITIGLYDLADYVRIIDMQGRTVYETQNNDAGELKLDISQYNKGIYFVMAKIGNALEKQKLIVE
jgi:sugar lactone lactonase YvrE